MMRNTLVFAVVFTMMAGVGLASEEDDSTSLSYISYLERYATVQPAGQEEAIEAVINLPLVSGDRIDTAREARVEVVLADSSIVWLDEYTSLSFDAVAFSRDTGGDRSVLFLSEGSMIIKVVETAGESLPTRIDSRSESLYLNQSGLYRVETTTGGSLRLEVWQGLAEASTTQGGVLVRAEYATELSNGQVSQMEKYQTGNDDFARWVEQRLQPVAGESALHVDTGYSRQASQLDNYGNWVYLEDDNLWAWQPHVSSSWRPYTAGRWYWTSTGWNWVSYEPWGWLPYHYGSWYQTAGYGWVWGWNSYWSPAWVSWVYWPGYVGWCPAGYHSYWWGHNYGWYGGYYGHHGGGGHGGSGGTPRRDVMPRGTSSAINSPRSSAVPRPTDLSLNVDGRVRLAEMDGRGWSVVEAENFGSAHLTRMVKPGDVALRNAGSAEGTVRSGTLRTASPSAIRTGVELDRAFRQGSSRSEPDVTRIMARDSSLSVDNALTLARPMSTSSLSRATVGGTPATQRSVSPSVSNLHRSAGNLYRPTMDTQQSSQGLGSSSARPSTTRASTISGARSIDSSSSGTNSRQSLTSGATGRSYNMRPQADAPSTPGSRGSSTTPSSSSSSTRSDSSTQGSRPVIVPRTSSSGTSSSARSFSSTRSIPSQGTSTTSSSNSSSNRTYARSPSPSSSSRSSATSSSSSTPSISRSNSSSSSRPSSAGSSSTTSRSSTGGSSSSASRSSSSGSSSSASSKPSTSSSSGSRKK